jgi:RND superfamily putative drug exporter
MLAAWARVVCRRRWQVLAASVAALALSIVALVRGGPLSSGIIEDIEAAHGLHLVEAATGRAGDAQFTIVLESATPAAGDARHSTAIGLGSDAWTTDDARFTSAVRDVVRALAADERVRAVDAPVDVPALLAARWTAADRRSVLVHVTLRGDFRTAARAYPAVRALVRPALAGAPITPTFTGYLAFKADLDTTLEHDLIRAEAVSVPLALLVLILVFGSLAAAMLPIGVGGVAVVGGVAIVMALSHAMDVAQYTINVVTLIGLGVAIDYSLFITSRFKEELAGGATVEAALATALATAGRAVAFSGLAVGIGLGGLLFYPRSYLFTMGLGGVIVVALAVVSALVMLPALLAILGARVGWGRVPWRWSAGSVPWRRIADAVMRRPIVVLVPTLAVMIAVALPFLRLEMAAADIRVLPHGVEARRGDAAIRAQFAAEAQNRVVVAVEFPDDGAGALTGPRVGALHALSRRIAAMPGVVRVESLVDLDPSLDVAAYQQLYALPPALRPADLEVAIGLLSGGRVAILAAVTDAAPDSDVARGLVHAIRADRVVGDGRLVVTGQTANDVDTTAFILDHTPAAVVFVMVMTYLVLLLALRSVLLPIKAVLMNLLSITGSFGALVWVFQDGHLAGVLGFEAGPIEPTLPVLLFCAIFGLSMDYEVLLLSRIQEEWQRTGDNRRAVGEGLARSGRLITSAAAIMVAVFVAFAAARVIVVKAMGVGMALAVALDATIVRVLLAPATMRLFGELNWWAPRWLRRRSP